MTKLQQFGDFATSKTGSVIAFVITIITFITIDTQEGLKNIDNVTRLVSPNTWYLLLKILPAAFVIASLLYMYGRILRINRKLRHAIIRIYELAFLRIGAGGIGATDREREEMKKILEDLKKM